MLFTQRPDDRLIDLVNDAELETHGQILDSETPIKTIKAQKQEFLDAYSIGIADKLSAALGILDKDIKGSYNPNDNTVDHKALINSIENACSQIGNILNVPIFQEGEQIELDPTLAQQYLMGVIDVTNIVGLQLRISLETPLSELKQKPGQGLGYG